MFIATKKTKYISPVGTTYNLYNYNPLGSRMQIMLPDL